MTPGELGGYNPEKEALSKKEFKRMMKEGKEMVKEQKQEEQEEAAADTLTPEEYKAMMKEGADIVAEELRKENKLDWFYKMLAEESEKEGPEENSKLYDIGRSFFKNVMFEKLLDIEKFEVNGLENLENYPKDKGALLVINHQGQLDPQLLMVALKDRQINFVAGQKANFGNKLMAKTFLKTGAIPISEPWGKRFQEEEEHGKEFIDPDLTDDIRKDLAGESIGVAAKRIENGNLVAIFAEGPVARRDQREIRRSSRGPARIIEQMKENGMNPDDINVFTITIDGGSTIAKNPINTKPEDFAWKWGSGEPGNVTVTVNEPLSVSDLESETKKIGQNPDDLQDLSDTIMSHVAANLPEKDRGPYKDTVEKLQAA